LTLDGVMALTHNCMFAAAIINGTSLPIGVHGVAGLKAQFPANFTAADSGSITIAAPEVDLSITMRENAVAIGLKTIVGRRYTLQKTAALAQPTSWINVGPAVSGDGAVKVFSEAILGEAGFYRALVE
jgi:hypothetical protein